MILVPESPPPPLLEYLTNLAFLVHTVSYALGLSIQRKNPIHDLQYRPQIQLVRGMYSPHFPSKSSQSNQFNTFEDTCKKIVKIHTRAATYTRYTGSPHIMDNREQQASKAVMFCELLPSINIVLMSLLKRRRAVSLTFHSRENKQHTRFSPNAYMYEEKKKRCEIPCMPKGVYARVYPFFVNFIWSSMMSLWE